MDEEAKFEIGIKAIFVNDKKEILLLRAGEEELKYNKDHWDLPGGRIQEGSNISETLDREVKEELGTNTKFEVLDIVSAGISNFKIKRPERVYSLMLIAFKCRLLTNNEIRLSNEHSEYKWFSLQEAKKLLATKFTDEFIQNLDRLFG